MTSSDCVSSARSEWTLLKSDNRGMAMLCEEICWVVMKPRPVLRCTDADALRWRTLLPIAVLKCDPRAVLRCTDANALRWGTCYHLLYWNVIHVLCWGVLMLMPMRCAEERCYHLLYWSVLMLMPMRCAVERCCAEVCVVPQMLGWGSFDELQLM